MNNNKEYSRKFTVNQNNGSFNRYKLMLEDARSISHIQDILKYADVCIKLSNDELIKLNDIAIKRKEELRQ